MIVNPANANQGIATIVIAKAVSVPRVAAIDHPGLRRCAVAREDYAQLAELAGGFIHEIKNRGGPDENDYMRVREYGVPT